MGEALAEVVKRAVQPMDIDVVIPVRPLEGHRVRATDARRLPPSRTIVTGAIAQVPDTARTAALELASKLNLPYREGFIKNRYIGRTFIMPGQQQRKKAVRRKLNAMQLEFMGKNVILVDGTGGRASRRATMRGTCANLLADQPRHAPL